MSADFSTEAVVIGAGVVGLAVARALAQAGRDVLILEKNARIGEETSARNSEVIHAGLYYPKNSLKAELCIEGRNRLYAFCESHNVPHRRLGKLIVATKTDQDRDLAAIRQKAADNGVTDLQPLSKVQVADLEPELISAGGLLSPSTGIIDSHTYMLALLGDAEAAGASLVRGAEAIAVTHRDRSYHIAVRNSGETITLRSHLLINCAGLWASRFAQLIEPLGPAFVPPTFLAKGSYATLNTRSPFRHLVYPVPEMGGLGVHLTLDMGGAARFGPDVEWLEGEDPAHIDYAVSPAISARFAPRIAAYWPNITDAMLTPGYSGVRPKIGGPGNPHADFQIDGPATHGLGGLVNLFGIESPGLTASLAIAGKVEGMLRDA